MSSVTEIIAKGEGLEIEFKESYDTLSRSVYETICAFLNRKGGHILLGVSDNGEIKGVNEDSIQSQLDTLERDLNNSQLISPTLRLIPEIFEIEGKKIISIFVPESSQVHKYRGIYYDRSGSGDYKLNNDHAIANLFIRKTERYTENKVYPYLDMSDFEPSLFDKVRYLAGINRKDHPWVEMSNEELLVSARMKLKDPFTGKEGYTLASALLFGTPTTIASLLPHYKTDALCRKVDTILYDDRVDIRSNLIEAYSQLMEFIRKHLPEKPYIEGIQRISLREVIFREMIANLLIHREFSNAYPATLTIYKDTVETENWNLPFQMGHISLQNLKPHPKNPVIANVFKQIGYAEELGSGSKKMYKYCPLLVADSYPEIVEEDVFKMRIWYDSPQNEKGGTVNGTVYGTVKLNNGIVTGSKEDLLRVISTERGLSADQLALKIGKSLRSVRRYIDQLRKDNLIEFRGAPKTGGYYLLDEK
jgi:ATP-dependent DNA helicase RecG